MVFACLQCLCRPCVPNWQSRPPEWQTPVAALLGYRGLPGMSKGTKSSQVVPRRWWVERLEYLMTVTERGLFCSSCWGRYETQIAEMEMFMKQTWEERPKWLCQVAAAKPSTWIYFNRTKRSSPFSTKKKEKDLNKRRFRHIKFERLCHVLVSSLLCRSLAFSPTKSPYFHTLRYLAIFRILLCMWQHVFFSKDLCLVHYIVWCYIDYNWLQLITYYYEMRSCLISTKTSLLGAKKHGAPQRRAKAEIFDAGREGAVTRSRPMAPTD